MTSDDVPFGLTRRRALGLGGAALGSIALGGTAVLAQDDDEDEPDDEGSGMDDENGENGENGESETRHYRVTVANLTPGQPFTPPAVAAHTAAVEVFAVGEKATAPTQALAENGNLEPLLELIGQTDEIKGAAVAETPLVPKGDPGETDLPYYTAVELSADSTAEFLTFASMLIATNDGIVGLDTVPLPEHVNESRTYYANGYDVGTEENTELFTDLVPPAKTLIIGGEAVGTDETNPDLAEGGVIRPHGGITGVGDLDPDIYGWDEPAAVVQVERIDSHDRTFRVVLSGDQEVPPVETDASGMATIKFDKARGVLTFTASVENIENAVAAHIHCAPVGENGPVGVTLYSGDPVSGDGVLTECEIPAPDDGNECGWESVEDVLAAFEAGTAYVNVHTEANPSGELRGQVA